MGADEDILSSGSDHLPYDTEIVSQGKIKGVTAFDQNFIPYFVNDYYCFKFVDISKHNDRKPGQYQTALFV